MTRSLSSGEAVLIAKLQLFVLDGRRDCFAAAHCSNDRSVLDLCCRFFFQLQQLPCRARRVLVFACLPVVMTATRC